MTSLSSKMGGGSNILFGDVGNRVIILDAYLPEIFLVEDDIITVSSGLKISSFIDKAMHFELGGLEFLSGIPAHIGGAIHMNAGAFDKCIFDYLMWIEYIDLKGKLTRLDRCRCKRQSKGSTLLWCYYFWFKS